MSCPICGAKINSSEELLAHLKEEHGMNIDPNFINNIMKGMGEVFGKIMSDAEFTSDTEGPKELDPTMFFGKMMEQLFNMFAKGMEGLQSDSSDETNQDMPNPFANMMQNIFGTSFPPEFEPEPESEPESESDTSSPSTTNEDDVKFQENSIEIPFVTDDDKKKKDQKENNE